LNQEFFACRPRAEDEFLPWSLVDHGLSAHYLRVEAGKARLGQLTPPCQPESCRACGACGPQLVKFKT
jgi:hypothetical protein